MKQRVCLKSHIVLKRQKAKTPWKNRMQALAYNIFTPSSDGDLVNRFLLIQKGRWIELSAKLPSKAKNYPAYKEGLLNANHLLGFQSGQEELEFSSLRPSSGGFIASFIPALIQGLRLKWDWFVRYPLKHYKETDGGAWSRKSPIWRFCFLMLAFLVMLIMPALSFSFGILWDEPDHISYADDVLRYFSTLGENTAVIDDEKRIYFAMRIYGIFFDTFSAFVYHVLSPFGIYETRHLLNALVGAFGMLYAGLLGRQLGWLESWLFGFSHHLPQPILLRSLDEQPQGHPICNGLHHGCLLPPFVSQATSKTSTKHRLVPHCWHCIRHKYSGRWTLGYGLCRHVHRNLLVNLHLPE